MGIEESEAMACCTTSEMIKSVTSSGQRYLKYGCLQENWLPECCHGNLKQINPMAGPDT